MKSNLKSQAVRTVSALVFLFFSAIAQASSNEVVVFLGTNDRSVFDETGMKFIENLYRQILPNARFVGILAPTGFETDEEMRFYFKQELQAKLAHNDVVKSLFLLFHGKTLFSKGTSTTVIEGLGEISEGGSVDLSFIKSTEVRKRLEDQIRRQDQENMITFGETFSGLRFAPDASIFLNSCSTACGTHDQVERRAENLAKALNLESGSIFMAKTKDYSPQLMTRSGVARRLLQRGRLEGHGQLLGVTLVSQLVMFGIMVGMLPPDIVATDLVLKTGATIAAGMGTLFLGAMELHHYLANNLSSYFILIRNRKARIVDEGKKRDLLYRALGAPVVTCESIFSGT